MNAKTKALLLSIVGAVVGAILGRLLGAYIGLFIGAILGGRIGGFSSEDVGRGLGVFLGASHGYFLAAYLDVSLVRLDGGTIISIIICMIFAGYVGTKFGMSTGKKANRLLKGLIFAFVCAFASICVTAYGNLPISGVLVNAPAGLVFGARAGRIVGAYTGKKIGGLISRVGSVGSRAATK